LKKKIGATHFLAKLLYLCNIIFYNKIRRKFFRRCASRSHVSGNEVAIRAWQLANDVLTVKNYTLLKENHEAFYFTAPERVSAQRLQ
jgi:hypothetical protein